MQTDKNLKEKIRTFPRAMSTEIEKEKIQQEILNQNDSTKNSDEEIDSTHNSIKQDTNEESEESRKERERRLSEEIDKAIQERKECIRKVCPV